MHIKTGQRFFTTTNHQPVACLSFDYVFVCWSETKQQSVLLTGTFSECLLQLQCKGLNLKNSHLFSYQHYGIQGQRASSVVYRERKLCMKGSSWRKNKAKTTGMSTNERFNVATDNDFCLIHKWSENRGEQLPKAHTVIIKLGCFVKKQLVLIQHNIIHINLLIVPMYLSVCAYIFPTKKWPLLWKERPYKRVLLTTCGQRMLRWESPHSVLSNPSHADEIFISKWSLICLSKSYSSLQMLFCHIAAVSHYDWEIMFLRTDLCWSLFVFCVTNYQIWVHLSFERKHMNSQLLRSITGYGKLPCHGLATWPACTCLSLIGVGSTPLHPSIGLSGYRERMDGWMDGWMEW